MSSKSLVTDIQKILHTARTKSYAAVNFAMVEAYWQIGRRIVEEEQRGKGRADYGAYLIKDLARQLTAEFGKGLDERAAIPNLNLTISTQSRQDAKILTFPRRNRQEYHLAQGQS
ncbi:MAG: DUF1016 N-terminal domain-containing protein [Anaerolineales bacterium]|nr:DUF1016 N-terminal domain-containing protein [Anaerolineales bacterium]